MDKLYSVQYLRAVSALAVIALHASTRVAEDLPEGVARYLTLGHAGVDLFFVISGFIMWTVGARHGVSPAVFLMRRILRVAPLYWIATLVWVALCLGLNLSWVRISLDHVMLSLFFLPHYNLTFPENIWPVFIPGWTLTYEMFFYLVFALSLHVPASRRLSALCLALCGSVLIGLWLIPQDPATITITSQLLLEFLGGCVVAELWRRQPGTLVRNALVLAAGVIFLLVYGPSVDPHSLWSRTLGYGFPALLIVSGTVGLGAVLPRSPLLTALGDASYAMYLFHIFVLTMMLKAWESQPMFQSGPTAVLFVAVALMVSSCCGTVVFRHLETPMQRWLSRTVLAAPKERAAHVASC